MTALTSLLPMILMTALSVTPASTVMTAMPVSFGFPIPDPALFAGFPRISASGIALACLVLLVVAIIWRALYEPGALEVTRRTLVARERDPDDGVLADQGTIHGDPSRGDRSEKDQAVLSDGSSAPGPARGEPVSVRVALFSDLHADSLRIRPEELIRAIRQAGVDALVFLGDLASDDAQATRAAPFLSEIADFARDARIPFFSVPGNHDGPVASQVLDALGISLLENQQTRFTTSSGAEVLVTGLADLRTGRPDSGLLKSQANHPIRIVLAHNPDTILELPEGGADFFLSGHFHGGQIYAPLQLEFRLLRPEVLPRRGIWRGAFHLNGYAGYITRGLGCVWLPLRLFSRPELALLDLQVPFARSGT